VWNRRSSRPARCEIHVPDESNWRRWIQNRYLSDYWTSVLVQLPEPTQQGGKLLGKYTTPTWHQSVLGNEEDALGVEGKKGETLATESGGTQIMNYRYLLSISIFACLPNTNMTINFKNSAIYNGRSMEFHKTSTVKVSNFGPFFQRSVASSDESCTKNNQNQICWSLVFLLLLSSSVFLGRVWIIASPSTKEVQSFHEVQS
jgi:hypothetical protein